MVRCAKREGKTKSSWYGRVSWTEADGTRRWQHVSARTKRDCEAAAIAAVQAGRAGDAPRDARRTVAAEVADWLAWQAGRVQPQSLRAYESALTHHVVPRLGRLPLARLTAAHVESVAAAMRDAGLAASHAAHVHGVFCAVLKRADRLDRIARNPCHKAEAPKGEKFAAAPLSAADARRLLDLAERDAFAVLWRFEVFAGLRLAEVTGLKWEDVDWERGAVAVRRQRKVVAGRAVELPPKSGAGRRAVALPPSVMAALAGERDRQTARHGAPSAWVFCARDGGPLSTRGLYERWRTLRERAGLPAMRFHDLRHTQGALLAAAGVHPKVAQARLGHATSAMTLDVYTHVVGDMDRRAAEALEALLAEQGANAEQKPNHEEEKTA